MTRTSRSRRRLGLDAVDRALIAAVALVAAADALLLLWIFGYVRF